MCAGIELRFQWFGVGHGHCGRKAFPSFPLTSSDYSRTWHSQHFVQCKFGCVETLFLFPVSGSIVQIYPHLPCATPSNRISVSLVGFADVSFPSMYYKEASSHRDNCVMNALIEPLTALAAASQWCIHSETAGKCFREHTTDPQPILSCQ